jgi:hypothetical protein
MISKLASALVSSLIAVSTIAAQETIKPAEKPRKAPTPLRLQVVYSRYQGEKKIASVPYTISFNSDDRPARLRMGVQVPIQSTSGNVNAIPTIQYRDVGNNIDVNANELEDGRFKLSCNFEQSSLSSADAAGGGTNLAPVLRNFRSEANLTMRDGQTVQYTAATDPVSGEVLKIDVTLTVVK